MDNTTLSLNGLSEVEYDYIYATDIETQNAKVTNLLEAKDIIVSGDLNVMGNQVFEGTSVLIGSQLLQGDSKIEGNLNVNGYVDLDSNVNIDQGLNLVGSATFGSNLYVSGNATFNSSLNIVGTLSISGHHINTDDVLEGNNLYYTDARSRLALTMGSGISYDTSIGKITLSANSSQIVESGNLYYTDNRARNAISTSIGLTYNKTSGVLSLSANSDNIIEGASNRYYTDIRSRAAITGSTNIPYNKTTGEIGLNVKGTIPVSTGDLGKWINANYGGASDYGLGQWSFGRTRLYTPNNYGSCGFATIDASGNIDDTFRVDYNKVGYMNGSLVVSGDINLPSSGFYKINNQALTTYHIPENPTGGGLYYTDNRARNAISTNLGLTYNKTSGVMSLSANSDTIGEGVTNKYYSDSRARLAISGSSGISYNSSSGIISLSANTSLVPEGSNLYFTNQRSTNALSTIGISFNVNNELGIVSTGPRANYALNIPKGIYISATGNHIRIDGTDSAANYKSELVFRSNNSLGIIKFDSLGKFIINRPVTFSSTSIFDGDSTFNAGIFLYNEPIKLVTPNMTWMNKTYGNSYDNYGIGEDSAKVRTYCAGSPIGQASVNLSLAYDLSAKKFYDVLRVKNGKVGIYANYNMTEGAMIGEGGPYVGSFTEPVLDGNVSLLITSQSNNTTQDTVQYYISLMTLANQIGTLTVSQLDETINRLRFTRALDINNPVLLDWKHRYFRDKAWSPSNITSGVDWNYAPYEIICNHYGQGDKFLIQMFPSGEVKFPTTARGSSGSYYAAIRSGDGLLYAWTAISDQKFKKDITEYSNTVLDEYRKIQIKNYKWKDDDQFKDNYGKYLPSISDEYGVEKIGFIAQDFVSSCPTIVKDFKIIREEGFSKDLPTGRGLSAGKQLGENNFQPEEYYLRIDEKNFHYLHIKAIQETNQRIDSLGGVDLEALRAENASLKTELASVKNELNNLITILKKKYII